LKLKKLFLWTDGRTYTYGQTDRRTFETHFIRSTQKSPPKNDDNVTADDDYDDDDDNDQ